MLALDGRGDDDQIVAVDVRGSCPMVTAMPRLASRSVAADASDRIR
jgi:hypothetical protein